MLENTPDHVDHPQPLGLESGLEALHASPEFPGPVEPLDGHECNEHFAVIYETSEERFATAVPFVRHGLERGERCMYVVEESAEADVLDAMRAGDIDVDAALDSGALAFHTVGETYLRTGTFDPDGMIEFYADAIDEATAEYDGLRVTADTTWLLDEGMTIEDFMESRAR